MLMENDEIVVERQKVCEICNDLYANVGIDKGSHLTTNPPDIENYLSISVIRDQRNQVSNNIQFDFTEVSEKDVFNQLKNVRTKKKTGI